MEKFAIQFACWLSSSISNGCGMDTKDLLAWQEVKKVLITQDDEVSKRLVVKIEYLIEREGYRK